MERSKEKEMKNHYLNPYLFLVCVFLCAMLLSSGSVHGQKVNRNLKPYNFGFKLGFNNLSSIRFDAYSGGTLLNSSQINKTGYTAGAFFRINLDKVFMQPEFEWSGYKHHFSFTFPNQTENVNLNSSASIRETMQTLGINIIVGYCIIQSVPFRFDVFIGPSLKYRYSTKYEYEGSISGDANNIRRHFYDNSTHLHPYGLVGFSFSVTQFYVDIRYGISIKDTDINFNEISNSIEQLNGVELRKNENSLNFSVGIFF
jgi:hypothetical protein